MVRECLLTSIAQMSDCQGAIDKAKVALPQANDETTKTLAAQIIKDQEREIAEMRE